MNFSKIKLNKNKLLEIRQQGVFEFYVFGFSKHRGYEFIFIFRFFLVLIKKLELIKDFLKIVFFIILKTFQFFSEFLIIFRETGDRFPIDSGTLHLHTIFFRVYMNL